MGSRIRENVERTFECFCEVKRGPEPRVGRIFPESYRGEEILRSVGRFVYPCDLGQVGFSRFSFVLTCADSKWMYGYCRHEPSAPLALLFLSHLPLHDTLYELLDRVAQAKRDIEKEIANSLIQIDQAEESPDKFPAAFLALLQDLYDRMPPPLQRHGLPSIPKNVNLTEYYCAVNYKGMIAMMASLLHERRIIVRSKRPCRISACVQAANDLLYPLVWQHIFIPVLPKFLSDCLLAPMPYLIGVPDQVFKDINLDDIGDVVVLDADKSEVESPFDDVKDLPLDVVARLLKELSSAPATGDVIPRAFLRTITFLIGGYREALKCTNGVMHFDNEIFISSRGPTMKPFLQKLTNLQTFQQFIDDRMELIKSGASQSDEFERECCNLERQGKSFGTKAFGAVGNKISISSFVRQVKQKTHPAVETAVESMRSGSRGVRTAYRGLKSKVDTTINSDKNKQTGRLSLPGPSGFSKVKDDPYFHEKGEVSSEHANNNGTSKKNMWNLQDSTRSDSILSTHNGKSVFFQSLPLMQSAGHSGDKPPPIGDRPTEKTGEIHDLIKLSDMNDTGVSAAANNADNALLQEYGLDFEKFSISRKNWTTFDE